MKTLYTAEATATGGREGKAETSDRKLSVQLSKPASNGPGTNPEQLFACGYAACFGGAVEYLAKQQKLDVGKSVSVTAHVNLNQDDKGGFFISAVLDVALPTLDAKTAHKLVQDAHAFCPYSKATHGNIDVTLKVNSSVISSKAA